MVKTYVKRPVEIQAVQWDGSNIEEIKEFAGEEAIFKNNIHSETPCLVILTLEGDHIASVGDYIIRGVEDEFYPCKPDIFMQVYEEVCYTSLNEPIYYFNEDRCVCCGRIIPEGRMICDICERPPFEDNDKRRIK